MSTKREKVGPVDHDAKNLVSLEAHWICEAEECFADGAGEAEEEPDNMETITSYFQALETLLGVRIVAFSKDLETMLYGVQTIDELEEQQH